MSEANTERTKLAAARALIQEKKYDLARSLLETMPENPTAQSWLAKLAGAKFADKPTSSRRWQRLNRTAVLLALLSLAIGVGGGLLIAPRPAESVPASITPTAPMVAEATAHETVEPAATVAVTAALTRQPTGIPSLPDTTLEASLETTAEFTPEATEEITPEDVLPTPPPIPEFDSTTGALVFDSATVGLTVLYEEITFPDGFYNVTATTTGALTLNINPLEGTCINGIFGLLELEAGAATTGANVSFGSEGCIAQLEVVNANAPWTLTFQQTGITPTTQAETFTYTSETEGQQAGIGPANGVYTVTVTTTGFITVNLQQLEGLCDVHILGLFNLLEGQATDGEVTEMSSDGCVGIILVNNATAPWSLTFTKIGDLASE